MQYTDMKEIERRPKQYWNADGLPDLVMGALFLLWGLALALRPGALRGPLILGDAPGG